MCVASNQTRCCTSFSYIAISVIQLFLIGTSRIHQELTELKLFQDMPRKKSNILIRYNYNKSATPNPQNKAQHNQNVYEEIIRFTSTLLEEQW